MKNCPRARPKFKSLFYKGRSFSPGLCGCARVCKERDDESSLERNKENGRKHSKEHFQKKVLSRRDATRRKNGPENVVFHVVFDKNLSDSFITLANKIACNFDFRRESELSKHVDFFFANTLCEHRNRGRARISHATTPV